MLWVDEGGVTWVELDLRTHARFLYTVHLKKWVTCGADKKTGRAIFYWEKWLEVKVWNQNNSLARLGKLAARPHKHRVTELRKEADVLASVSDDGALCSCTCGRALSSPCWLCWDAAFPLWWFSDVGNGRFVQNLFGTFERTGIETFLQTKKFTSNLSGILTQTKCWCLTGSSKPEVI